MARMEYERLGDLTARQLTNIRSLDYCRWISCLAFADGSSVGAGREFARRFPRSHNLDLIQKAAVAPGTTTDATFAAPLVSLRTLTDAFLEYSRPATIIGKIPNLRRVPFNISVSAQSGGGTYGWTGEGAPTALTQATFASIAVPGTPKAAGIIVVTAELLKLGVPDADVILRNELVAGIAQFLDSQFVDPAVAAVANVHPASITNGLTPIASTGPTNANAAADINALIRAFVTANPNVEFAVLVVSPANAMALASTGNYPHLRIDGGFVAGIPVVTSGSVGDRLVLLDAQAILVADDGGLNVDVSRQASVQMDSAPTNPPTATTIHVSLWQLNLVGLKAERFINWTRARSSAVAFVSGAAYTGVAA